MADTEKKPGFFARISRSFRDMKGEMKKVVWPSKKQIWIPSWVSWSASPSGADPLPEGSVKDGRRSKMVCGPHLLRL